MKKFIGIIFATMLSSQASAAFIQGSIGFGGEFERNGDSYTFSNVEVDNASGDLASAGIADDDALTVGGFDLGAFTPTVLWAANGFSYTLNTITVLWDNPNIATIITGSGTLSGNGFQDTSFALTFSSNAGGTFSASAVPAPGTAALMLLGLAGATLRKRQLTV
ncbi:MAG: PEP-CTERM sorting domain-containing protein [Pseudomonadales bacterium]